MTRKVCSSSKNSPKSSAKAEPRCNTQTNGPLGPTGPQGTTGDHWLLKPHWSTWPNQLSESHLPEWHHSSKPNHGKKDGSGIPPTNDKEGGSCSQHLATRNGTLLMEMQHQQIKTKEVLQSLPLGNKRLHQKIIEWQWTPQPLTDSWRPQDKETHTAFWMPTRRMLKP